MKALEQLLGKARAGTFLKRAWPDEHFVVHRRLSDLPQPLREAPLRSFAELAEVYAGRVQVAGGHGDDHLQFSVSSAPTEYLRRIGLTVFFGDDVSGLAPGGAAFLRNLEGELGAPAGIGAIRMFCSPKGGGLGAHYDQGETFIVQLAGTKRIWLKRNTLYPALQFAPGKPPSDGHYPEFADRGFPARAPRGGVRVTLKPGTVLFVPRGMWHRTEAGSASFSASICVDIPNAIDVLVPQLQAALKQHALFRRPLFGAWGSGRASCERQLARALEAVSAALPRLSAELMIDGVGEVDVESLPIRLGTRFQRVPSTRLTLTGKQLLTVRTWGGKREAKLAISPPLVASARWLATRRPAFSLKQLVEAAPSASEHDATVLLRRLVECEALKWLPFPALTPLP